MSRSSEFWSLRRMRDESGSMMMAVIMVFAITGVITAALVTATAGVDKTRQDGRFLAAIQGADAGMQSAFLTINQTAADAAGPLTGGPLVIDGVSYQWTATKTSALEWSVTSTGTRTAEGASTSRTVTAKVKQTPLFPLAAFADTSIGFNGNNGASSYPVAGFGIVGSNGELNLKNNTTADGAVLYDYAADPDPSRCQNGPCATKLTTVDDHLDVKAAVAQGGFIKQQLDACKAAAPGGNLQPFVGTTISPKADGTPYCFSSFLADTQNFVVGGTGPVKIFVDGDVTLGNKNHSDVNYGVPSAPESIRLQIYSTGTSVNMYNQSNLATAVYAPNATCGGVTSNAGSDVYGSLVCNIIDNVGGWNFHYDTRLGGIGDGRWRMFEYNES